MANLSKISIMVLFLFFASCTKESAIAPTPAQPESKYKWVQSIHTTLGVPEDSDTTDDYIILRPQYALSYNKYRNVPNWVAWRLNESWFGDVSRYSGNFITDTSLPESYYRVKHSDYTNSGYDRGHMVMSEERTDNATDNKSTFIMSNIIPQSPDLNQGVWLSFEKYCNELSHQGKELFIFAGGIYHSNKYINDKVSISDSCFKIVVVLESGQTWKDVNAKTQVMAIVMPNIQGVRNDPWEMYKTTVRRIENSTGYNFLSKIPIKIQNIIENK